MVFLGDSQEIEALLPLLQVIFAGIKVTCVEIDHHQTTTLLSKLVNMIMFPFHPLHICLEFWRLFSPTDKTIILQDNKLEGTGRDERERGGGDRQTDSLCVHAFDCKYDTISSQRQKEKQADSLHQ